MPEILNPDYSLAEWLQADPICGVDFCDTCGDCLACYGDDPCVVGDHRWIVYAEQVAEFRAKHEV